MKTILFTLCFFSGMLSLNAQNKGRFSVEINYGLCGNFFVRSYEEITSLYNKSFYNKNFIGLIGGAELKYRLGAVSNIRLGYSRSVNDREIDYSSPTLVITDFHIRHINHFFQLGFERSFSKKKPSLKYDVGLVYMRFNQQEVDVSVFGASFEERNFKTYRLEEGGVFVGLHYSKKIDTKFDIGIRSRLYYLISTNTFDTITLTPTLTYHF
ncbi:MAG: hypothetical protein HC913_20765 [Microscillaceae bacterium]|nr:hypothetical protein [Microscillaceae bacterium]